MNAATAGDDDVWRFQPITQTYPDQDGGRCGLELAPDYARDKEAMDRIALMIATALPGVNVNRGDGEHRHLVILVGKYYMGTLDGMRHNILNQKLAEVEPDPVVCLERTSRLLWVLGFRSLEVYTNHVHALQAIPGIEAVTPLNDGHQGRAVELYVPGLGVRSPDGDDKVASADLLARIRAKFDFAFTRPPAQPAAALAQA